MTESADEEPVRSNVEPRLRVDILTIFPSLFKGPFGASILKRAQEKRIVQIDIHDIREWTTGKHRSVDDTPYGGGAGMVMMAPPIVAAAEEILKVRDTQTKVVILSPSGKLFTQALAAEFALFARLMLICGRYEGIDDRVREILDAEEISIGDYVLTGGELAAAIIVDAVARLIPGVITAESTESESHADSLVEYPHYTRPQEYRGLSVPEVLLSGHHKEIAAWRRAQAIQRTAKRRPDLLADANLSQKERADVQIGDRDDNSSSS